MIRTLQGLFLFCILTMFSASCVFRSSVENKLGQAVPLPAYGSLEKFPFREAWYGMYFHDDKVGYSHFKIDPDGRNFTITSDSFMRLAAPKRTDEIEMKEKVMVRPDITMISFDSVVHMNGKEMKMIGRSEGDQLLVDIRVDGNTMNRRYLLDGKVFHASAISLMPALNGLKDGESHSFKVFNAEKQGMQNVDQEMFLVKGTPGPSGAVWKVKNKYGSSLVYSWLDDKGLAVIEKALTGALITLLEDESTAKDFLERKAPGKRAQIFGIIANRLLSFPQ